MERRWNELLMDDHQTTEKVLVAMENVFGAAAAPARETVAMMLDYFAVYVDQCHNMKEERHLFPLIERRGIPRAGGPLAVMLGEHEQARALLARITPLATAYVDGDDSGLAPLRETVLEYAGLLKNHFWKENDVLYPMALRVMKPEDDATVRAGIGAVETALGPDTHQHYYALAERLNRAGQVEDLSCGVEREVLAAILNTLPVELSFVDAEDTVRYFSHENGDKIFPRTRGVIGMKVQNCHPGKSVHKVNQILAEFKAGKRDVAEFWIDLGPKKVHIRYWPVRDVAGKYLGCLETVQDISAMQNLKGQRRLLDPA